METTEIKIKCLELAFLNNKGLNASASSLIEDAKAYYDWIAFVPTESKPVHITAIPSV